MMNHFTIMDLEELEYGASRIERFLEREKRPFTPYFEMEPFFGVHHVVFFNFSNSEEFENVLRKTLRDNDIILRKDNCYYLRLSGLTEEGKNRVVGRVIKNLEKEGLCSVLNMNVDASVLEEEREDWYRIAV